MHERRSTVTDFTRTTDSRLQRLYQGGSKMVAFVDESYLSIPVTGVPFYFAMTAVVLSSADIDSVRWAYAEQAGHRKWHTTERFRDGRVDEIRQFVSLLVTEADPVVIVVQVDDEIDREDVEDARRACFMKLVQIVHDVHLVRLVVYERRRPGHEQDRDDATARALRNGFDHLDVVDAWSGSEPLLWGPDIVAWTFQRKLVRRENWFEPLAGITGVYRDDGSVIAE